jgi:tetratricopeptide (TPR) repeat protein
VYAVVGNRPPGARREWQGRRPLSPFVGREQELATLRERLRQVEGGRGQVVGVIGEPGIGKSRLCDEFVRGAMARPWLILQTQGAAYGQATPYLPVIDLLKRYFHIDGREDRATIRDKVTATLHGLDDTLTPAAPAFLTLLEAPVEDPQWQVLEAAQRRQRTLEALKRVLVRASQVQPVLLIVEDLHWIDTETQAFLDTLVDSLPTARLLLLVSYRPEYRHSWGHKTAYTQLRLDSLPPASADELLRTLLGDDSSLAPLTTLLIARTEGNPFFLEESVQTLVETQGLVGERGAYRLTKALPNIQVPATVQAVLAARIDRLPPEAKRLLQTAAVIGPEIPVPLLHTLAELPEDAMHRGLTQLQAAEFLYETRLFPEMGYTFKHPLTQQVAYETLPQERRRALHARIVAALLLAKQEGQEYLPILARGYLGELYLAQGDLARAIRVWEEGLALCRASDIRYGVRPIVAGLGSAYALQGRITEGRALLEEVIRLDIRTGAWFNHPRLVVQLSEVCRLAGHREEARQHAHQALDLARRQKARGDEAVALYQLGVIHAHADPPDAVQAEAHYQRALALAEELGMRPLQAHCHRGLGALYTKTGQLEQARAAMATAIDFYRAMDMTFWLPEAEAALAQIGG